MIIENPDFHLNDKKNLLYIGQYGTCGYAVAARAALYDFYIKGFNIKWNPLYFDNTTLDDDDPYNIIIKSFIHKDLYNYDLVFLHSTPDLWPEIKNCYKKYHESKMLYGYCTWETNVLPKNWVNCINSSVHVALVPSNFNREVFQNSGVTVPIQVYPHIFLSNPKPITNKYKLSDSSIDDCYKFYTIGELNNRKNILALVDLFCSTFHRKKDVCLIVKTHYKNYDQQSFIHCNNEINKILFKYSYPPKVMVLLDNMSMEKITWLHSYGDCYISLTKSEGFGLTIFDAYNYKRPIIVTGYGGQLDYLGKDYPGLVKYKMERVPDEMRTFSLYYEQDQEWASPDLNDAAEKMLHYYEQRIRSV